nr:ribonuclease H-like domain-containing protein [Tanacetum cinerariifolium]
MSLEEIREKFIPIWKQIEDFVPMGSKEEGERFKRKGLRLEQDSAKKVKTSKEVSEEDLKTMMQLVPVEEVYAKALQVKHPIIDWEIHTEGQRTYLKIISDEFPLQEDFPTGSEERFPLLSYSVILGKYPMIDPGNSQNVIDDKRYWDSGCSWHMTGNISYLSDYEPFDGGDFKLRDDTNVLLRTPRQHNMYSIDLNNIIPHKDLTCLIAKAFVDESELWHKRLGHLNFKTMNRKWIKREFNNARTPQQNEVTEKRNRTLIEVARTMLADAKLPITFWAKAVNTACYVQNRVLVNKSQNKTSYELLNGRTPAILFLKSFGCHVMILNTLDNLRKFEAKGDEGYFTVYSMSSKSFRVFNKRTKRVEENMHAEFLENKLIEKGAGPNWLFDIDSLTNSMNNVPVVSVGTTSTNFLAYLESSTSNAQDTCKADAPESSGNSNPTATSTTPMADHMETLTVETLIPTVSSLVPTACLDDSPQLSSDTRLISKRVTSQDDTPSLDNILTLSNRFEDILRVTTNIGDSHGVEADLGNMEDNISASPWALPLQDNQPNSKHSRF